MNKKIQKRSFPLGKQVLLFNSCLHLFPRKQRIRSSGSFIIKEVFPHKTIELLQASGGPWFKVNGQRVKHHCVIVTMSG